MDSLHKTAIEYLVHKIPGAINNHYANNGTRILMNRRIPDIVVKNSGKIAEVYEVETFHKLSLPKTGVKRVLVIALEDDDWDEVKILTTHGDLYRAHNQELRKITESIKVQKSRLKGYNTRIGRKLSLAKEKKRVDEGWE